MYDSGIEGNHPKDLGSLPVNMREKIKQALRQPITDPR